MPLGCMHYDGDFFMYFSSPTTEKIRKIASISMHDDALRWSQSPTSTSDAILGRFLQMTARWKALIELEPVRLLTGWLLWLHGFGLGMVGRFRADHQGSRQREFFCLALTTLMALMDLIYPNRRLIP